MYNAFISYSHAADGRMAPALQHALEKFAKPWYKLRNLDVFRDEESLSASPHLWSNIQQSLDKSEYLIYMASPVSAASKWVRKEIQYWLDNKPLEKLLIVLTDGSIAWDEKSNFFLDPAHNSLPDELEQKFIQEPFYIDLRSLKTEEDLSLNNSIFKKEVLKLAAHLHGKAPKDMASEEVLAYRKMKIVRNSAIGLLVLLLVASISAAFIANKNANEAKRQTKEAKRQEGIANDNADKAQKNAAEAKRQEGIAIDNAAIAQANAEEANRQKDSADYQRRIAIKERNIARMNLANSLISEAQREQNPTLGILYAKEALSIMPSKEIYSKAYNIYTDNNFYRSIFHNYHLFMQDSVAFLPGGKTFITYGDLGNEFDEGTKKDEKPFYFKQQKKIIAEGEKYRVWSLSGQLLDELTEDEVRKTYGFPFNKKFRSPAVTLDKNNFKIIVKDSSGQLINEFFFDGINNDVEIWKSFLSYDNKKFISVWTDGIIRIWDVATGFLFTYKNHQEGLVYSTKYGGVLSLAFSEDGKKMITITDRIVRLWDMDDNCLINSSGDKKSKDRISFSSDNKAIIIKSGNERWQWDEDDEYFRPYLSDDSICLKEPKFETYWGPPGYKMYDNKMIKLKKGLTEIKENTLVYYQSQDIIITKKSWGRFDALWIWQINTRNENEYLLKSTIPLSRRQNLNGVWLSNKRNKIVVQIMDVTENGRGQWILKLWDIDQDICLKTFPAIQTNNFNERLSLLFSPDDKRIFLSCPRWFSLWNCPENIDEFFKKRNLATLSEEKKVAEKFIYLRKN